jgi:hypothetical protein
MDLMHKVFGDSLERGVLIFLDDILIYSRTADEHEALLREVFTRLRNNRLFAKASKCELWRSQVTFPATSSALTAYRWKIRRSAL